MDNSTVSRNTTGNGGVGGIGGMEHFHRLGLLLQEVMEGLVDMAGELTTAER